MKSFFDYSDKEKKAIIQKAADEGAKMQQKEMKEWSKSMNTYDERVREKISAIILDYAKEGEDAGDLDKTVDAVLSLRFTLEKPIEGEWENDFYEKFTFGGKTGIVALKTDKSFEIRDFIRQTILTERAKWKREMVGLIGEDEVTYKSMGRKHTVHYCSNKKCGRFYPVDEGEKDCNFCSVCGSEIRKTIEDVIHIDLEACHCNTFRSELRKKLEEA